MSCLSLTSAAGLTTALFPGYSHGAFYLAFHTSAMPVKRGAGTLILQRSLAWLSWGWSCPSLCSLRLVAMATCACGSMEGSRCCLGGHPAPCLSLPQLKQFERLEQEVTRPIDNDLSNWSPPQHYSPARGGGTLCPADRQLLLFYLEQCEANLTTLTNAVDAFFTAVSTNQPPKIFVAHSKFVILSAHKLVFIGDTLSRQAKAQDVQHKVMHYSNLLCEMLKEIVMTTKAAALHYPSPAASKDMVERVKDLANSTQQFRMVLGQLAAM